MWPLRTALVFSQAGRARMASTLTFIPHHEARMTSGSRATTADGSTTRSFALPHSSSSGKIGSPPAMTMSSSTQRMPLMSGSFHSSKKTRGRRGNFRAEASISRRPFCSFSMSARPSSGLPTRRASMAIMSKISAMLRWLKLRTVAPRSTRLRVISACTSEKVRTRSGLRSRMASMLASRNAETRGLLRTSGGRLAYPETPTMRSCSPRR
jgi:hypothetical protein